MKLRKAHPVGVFDYQRIDIGYVNARLDYGCAYKNIDFTVEKTPPYFAELRLIHLAVSNGHPRFG